MKCLLDYEFSKFGCGKCGAKLFCIIRKKYIKQMETKEMETKFEENSIVRCTTNELKRFSEGRLYRIVSKDFEHTKGYSYGIVNDAGCIDYFPEDVLTINFTEEETPKETIRFSNIDEASRIKDNVNHPSHYTWLKDLCGVEVIDITRHMDFDLGCVLKYVLRAGKKKEMGLSDIEKEIEDLSKAKFYLNDKIAFLKDEQRNLEKGGKDN